MKPWSIFLALAGAIEASEKIWSWKTVLENFNLHALSETGSESGTPVHGVSNKLVDDSQGSLPWKECDDLNKFECSVMHTPLDYTNLSDHRNASIAVVRYRAGGGDTPRSEVLGSVILNPGGPGGSGVAFLKREGLAASIDKILDSRYDLVSFDPRGVGASWPRVQCFNDSYADLVYSVVVAAQGVPGQHGSQIREDEVGATLAAQQLIGDVCMRHADAELFQYMSTPFVARDMHHLHKLLGDDKINYWGFSYGTVLGSVYADMFPEDVNRLVIDGVADASNYLSGLWSHRLKDVEQEFSAFFTECFEGGAEHCKLSTLAPNATALKALVLDFNNKLKLRPIPLADASPPQLFTATDLFSKFYSAMYAPKSWPQLADSLYEALVNQNATSLSRTIDVHPPVSAEDEGTLAISCGDAGADPAREDGSSAWTNSEFYDFIAPVLEDSPLFATVSGIASRATCFGAWQKRGAERHAGNFSGPTSFPILAIGNDFDPATPGRYADMIAAQFGGVSVRRAGYGHCSASQPSRCIDGVLRSYFVHGELPLQHTRCEVDEPVFASTSPISPIAQALLQVVARSHQS